MVRIQEMNILTVARSRSGSNANKEMCYGIQRERDTQIGVTHAESQWQDKKRKHEMRTQQP